MSYFTRVIGKGRHIRRFLICTNKLDGERIYVIFKTGKTKGGPVRYFPKKKRWSF